MAATWRSRVQNDCLRRSPAVIALTSVLLAVGCGPAVTGPSAPTGAKQFVYQVDDGVSDADQAVIRESLDAGQRFFRDAFGKDVPGTVRIMITRDTNDASSANGDTIIFSTGSASWVKLSEAIKRKIAVHELFHVFQTAYGLSDGQDTWWIEGGAEYIAWQFLDAAGLVPFRTAIGCQIWNLLFSSVPVPTLREGGIPANGTYWLAVLAIDFMAQGQLTVFANIVNAPGARWDAKMTAVTGKSRDQFYDEFEAKRATFQKPSSYQCPR